jgi:hypothetical protein
MMSVNNKIRSLFSLCAVSFVLSIFLASASFAGQGGTVYSVVDPVVPIMSKRGAKYKIIGSAKPEDTTLEDGENLEGALVYGNRVTVREVSSKNLKGSWGELLSPADGTRLGFIPMKGLEKFPAVKNYEPRDYLVLRDSPELTLMPGKSDKKYLLSPFGYELIKGEVVTAYGEFAAKDGIWLLLGFGSSSEAYTDAGVGMRYAWARAGDMRPLSSYEPDNSEVGEALLPKKIRNSMLLDYENKATAADFETLSEKTKKALSANGFWINHSPMYAEYVGLDDMADAYAGTRDYAVDFITTDMFLHAWHLIFDRMLQRAESGYLSGALDKAMTRAAAELGEARGRLSVPDGSYESVAYDSALDAFEITRSLLGNEQASPSPKALEEIKRITDAKGFAPSLITGADTDYSQYRPRGHYTLTPELQRYFRAMTFLGDAGRDLFSETGEPVTEAIRTAVLITLVMDAAGKDWTNFEAPVNFLFGRADDAGPSELLPPVKRVIGDYSGLAGDKKIKRLAAEIKAKVSPPRIGVAGSGINFRLSGKKFNFDAYIFTMLTEPSVRGRALPEGTDVMTVLGSGAAAEVSSRNWKYPAYQGIIGSLTDEFRSFAQEDGTVFTRWLDLLGDSFKDSGSKQFFYGTPAWRWKKLLTASASWAELKHDTVLYAKQSGAEMGGGPVWEAGKFEPPYPRGYVEPDPQTFGAIIKIIERTEDFIAQFPFDGKEGEYGGKLGKLKALCLTARDIAAREADGRELSVNDYKNIKSLARSFTNDLLLPSDMALYLDPEDVRDQLKMALITDAATDPITAETILLAGVGTPRAVYVFVNDKSGGYRAARGYVYSYYEFVSGSDNRMTDAEWKKMVYDPQKAGELRKLHPSWYRHLGD